MSFLFVAIGGALGSVLRYAVSIGGSRWYGDGFPWATFAVNVIGAFLMGIAVSLFIERMDEAPRWLPGVTAGFLGGFTTFSAFSLETYLLLEGGRFWMAVAYMAGSVLVSLVALAVGITLARMLS